MSNKQVRVRFAPSPSGYLHVGGARTALFNWLWAKKTNGIFYVRIEDSNSEKSTEESKNIILDSLKWLGLSWDEGPDVGGKYGPYIQSERVGTYKHYADKLISEGKAYKCFCTEEDLRKQKEEWTKNNPKVGFKYPGTCKTRKDDGNPNYVVRFVAPRDGITEFTDKIYGKISTPNVENQDWILMRSDGLPLYNFGAVVDDSLMETSMVCRGSDHLQNTVPQILLYQALGFEVPEFAHMPLMRAMGTNEKLSKRHGSVSVSEYRDKGFPPGALLSYLAKCGWGHKDQELFSIQNLIELFDWSGCTKSDAKFDFKKLDAINFQYLKSPTLTNDEEYATLLLQYMPAGTDINHLRSLIPLVRTRAKTLVDAAKELEPIIKQDISLDKDAYIKLITDTTKPNLEQYANFLSTINAWEENHLRNETNAWLTKVNLTIKDIGQPVRLSITGRTNSPELFQVMHALGKEKTVSRLKQAIAS